ncbi:ABC transporter substrate-binding protein [Cohnella caldifontis]|uniref:ABC transporter substrate-binding protein n=1 Tax=Cohnella caldifontis TaxID=3027471 RepID=UPI0023ED1D30|nr:ABC transporter substrate-binding protein [Cohnella sp. YIM B05605]
MRNTRARRRLLVSLLFTLAVSLPAAGCSSQGKTETPAAPSGESSAPSGNASAPSGDAAAKSGGTLNVASLEDAVILGNPPTIMNQADPNYAAPAVERLFRRTDDGEIEPFLAKGYEVAADRTSITIGLNQGIKFHDGADFNADAVKWNLDRYIETKRSELAKVRSVDVVDEYTVKLNLTEYDGLLLPYLSSIPGMMISPKSAGEHDPQWTETHPVGTGPYKFVSWDRSQKIVYEKFADYWQGEPKLDRLVISVIADPMTQAAAFENGDVDVLMNVDAKSASDLQAKGKFDVTPSKLANAVLGLVPDSAHEKSVYANLKVRQAVWHAIDFAAIAKTLGYGFFEPTTQLAAPGSAAYNADVKGYAYDPEAAKKLLAEAGYAQGFDTTLYAQNTAGYANILTAAQGYLKAVGINAKVELLDQGKYATMLTGGPEKGGWSDGLTIIPFTVVPNELGAYTRLLGPQVSAVRMPSLYNPDEMKTLIGEAAVEPDPDKARNLVRQIQKVATDDQAALFWIYASKNVSAKQKYVKDDHFNSPQWTPEQVWLDK